MAYINGKQTFFSTLVEEAQSPSIEIVQETGDSGTAVMSQKAVTDEFGKYFIFEKSANLFDKTKPREPNFIMGNGQFLTAAGYETAILSVEVGKTYTFPIYYSVFSYHAAYFIACYDAELNYLGRITGTPNADNSLLTLTITPTVINPITGATETATVAFIKVGVSIINTPINFNNFMFVEGTEYPSEYIPFVEATSLSPNVLPVAQTTGDSEKAVMSQKAVTDSLEATQKAVTDSLEATQKTVTDSLEATQKTVTDEFNKYFLHEKSANLFDKSVSLTPGLIMSNGVVSTNANFSHFMFAVEVGKTYTFPIRPSMFGVPAAYRIPCYNSSGEYLGYITGTAVATANEKVENLTFTHNDTVYSTSVWGDVPNAGVAYIKVNVSTSSAVSPDLNTFMLVEGSEYPSEYIPFIDVTRMAPEVLPVVLNGLGEDANYPVSQKTVTELFGNLVETESYINVFDNTREHVSGLLMPSGTVIARELCSICSVDVNIGNEYIYPIYYKEFGYDEAACGVACYDENDNYLGRLTGALDDKKQYLTVKISSTISNPTTGAAINNAPIKRIKINVFNHQINSFMVIEGVKYPNVFVPYNTILTINKLNSDIQISGTGVLKGKRIVFTGDSICAGTTDETGVRGWAQRIGQNNDMEWENKGVNGATITSTAVTSASACIADTDFGESPDYIIIEGGTNDADHIGFDADGKPNANFGSYNLTDYSGNFNKQTFCGAFEHLLHRVISTYPHAKVGYIVAHKMGNINGSGIFPYGDYTAEHNPRRYYFEVAMTLCKKWGVPYINLWDGSPLNPLIASHATGEDALYYNNDNQHLTAKGYDFITPMIEAWIKKL